MLDIIVLLAYALHSVLEGEGIYDIQAITGASLEDCQKISNLVTMIGKSHDGYKIDGEQLVARIKQAQLKTWELIELNDNELKVLNAVFDNIQDETGGQFGWSDGIEVDGLSKHQVAGYISQLSQKDLILLHNDDSKYTQTQATEKGVKVAGRTEWFEF